MDRYRYSECYLTYLATSSLPSTNTYAFVDICTSSSVLAGRSAQGCKTHTRTHTCFFVFPSWYNAYFNRQCC